jgi:phosphate-selective porin OprO and OprP
VRLRVQLAFAPLDQDPVAPYPVRDAFVTFAPLRELNLRVGQMKVPFGRQRVVSSGAQQMVDRSIVTGELNLDRDVGMQIFSEDLFGLDGWLGYALGVFGGDGRNRVSGGYGLLYAARLALRPAGGARGDDLDEVDFERGERVKLTLAGSAAFNHDTDRQRSTIGPVFENGPWADYWHAGGDVSLKWRGLSMTGEAFLRRALEERRTVVVEGEEVTDETRSGFGSFFQLGQLLGEHVELSARVGALRPLGAAGGMARENEIGGGLSYYVLRHTLKVQADTFYLFDQWGDGRVQARLQLQVFP